MRSLVEHTRRHLLAVNQEVVEGTKIRVKSPEDLTIQATLSKWVLLAASLGRPASELMLVVLEDETAHADEAIFPVLKANVPEIRIRCRVGNASENTREGHVVKPSAEVMPATLQVKVGALCRKSEVSIFLGSPNRIKGVNMTECLARRARRLDSVPESPLKNVFPKENAETYQDGPLLSG